MNKISLLLVLLALPSTSFAGLDAIKAANNQVGIQYVDTDVDYTEKIDGQKVDTEKGHVPGFGLSISFMKDLFLGNDYIQAQFSRLNGDTNYTGSSYLGPTIAQQSAVYTNYGTLKQNDDAQMTDYSFRYGKGFSINDNVMLTPYAEIGRHEWKRSVGNFAVDIANGSSATEYYKNNYWGVGALGQVSPAESLVLTLNAFIGRTFDSKISGDGATNVFAISTFGGSFGNQKLGNSTIYKVGIAADYAFTENIHGNIGVDYTSFDYGKSGLFSTLPGVVPTSFEPNSETRYTTVKAGIGYAF